MRRITRQCGICVVLSIAVNANAQNYPVKPVRIVVPFAAGGPYDDIARTLGQRLTEI